MAAVICSDIMTTTAEDAGAGRSGTTTVVGTNATVVEGSSADVVAWGGDGWVVVGGGPDISNTILIGLRILSETRRRL